MDEEGREGAEGMEGMEGRVTGVTNAPLPVDTSEGGDEKAAPPGEGVLAEGAKPVKVSMG